MRNYSCYKKNNGYRDNLSNINVNKLYIPNINERIIIIDTLNTGANPKENNIMEIGCMEMIGGKITGYEFHAFLHPRYSINEVTKQKTNLNSNYYEDYYKDVYASDRKVLEQLKNFVNRSIIVAHNAFKEMEFINNEFSYYKMSIYPKKKFFCTLNLFREMFPNISRSVCSLNKCCEYLEINLPGEKYHSAKYDSFVVAKLMSKMYNIINEIKTNEILIENLTENKQTSPKTPLTPEINSSSYQINNDSDNIIDIFEEENYNRNKNETNSFNSGGAIEKPLKENNSSTLKSTHKKNEECCESTKNKEIKLLNNKRVDFEDLLENLKNKVSPNTAIKSKNSEKEEEDIKNEKKI